MAKVIPFHGAAPSGWSRERWAWLKRLSAEQNLSATAKLLAWVMATQFAPRDLPECSPGLEKLCEAVALQKRQVMSGLAELVAGNWLERGGGNGPGRRAVYRFTSGEQVQDTAPEQVQDTAPEQVRQNAQTGAGYRTCEEIPPAPPYKDTPNMNQRPAPRFATKIIVPNAGRPTQVCQLVEPGSDAAGAWDAWLRANGFPGVQTIGRRIKSGQLEGWDFPTRWPPSASDDTGTRIAKRFAEWLRGLA